jgi:hypothetical protein
MTTMTDIAKLPLSELARTVVHPGVDLAARIRAWEEIDRRKGKYGWSCVDLPPIWGTRYAPELGQ